MTEPAFGVTVPGAVATPTFETILVPLDGSTLAAGALGTARALAARFHATIHTITVVHPGDDVAELRAEAARELGVDANDARVRIEAATDVPGAIQQHAAELESCLVCLSTHGRGRVAGTLVGSVARAVIERFGAPVVAIGPMATHATERDAPPPLVADQLVACVDGSRASESVLPVAAAWANALALRLVIVTVAEPCLPPERPGATWRRHHGPQTDADEYVRTLAERWAPAAPSVEATVVYDPISPAAGISDYLGDHPTGLIALASHLRSGLDRIALGATAADIVHASTAPALIVPIAAS